MGRRKANPDDQKAQGFPGKRRTKVERQIEQAEKLAALLASAPAESGDRLAPPALLLDPRCAPALGVWRDYTPRLAKLNLFGELDRHTFAIFCVYSAEFAAAQQDILDNGYSRNVKTVSGDLMPRVNPSVDRRDTAQKIILEMARRFGLTPLDQMQLLGQQAALPMGGLFAGQSVRPVAGAAADQPSPQPETAPPAQDVVGVLDQLDSPAPGRLQ
ncbi:P27 family phage terminase small subunit [Methylocella sp.]|uniref:P27 family phage terminase small subunit n=1 Tax=Methylocella sp. TaxID=1978226 RepID=UPI0035B2C88F